MKTTIIGRQMNVYDETKTLIEKKLEKFDKYFRGEPEAFVTLRKVRESDRMEVTISCNGTLFRAEKTSPTFRRACGGRVLRRGERVQDQDEELPSQAHDGGRGDTADEPSRSQLLRLQGRPDGRDERGIQA